MSTEDDLTSQMWDQMQMVVNRASAMIRDLRRENAQLKAEVTRQSNLVGEVYEQLVEVRLELERRARGDHA